METGGFNCIDWEDNEPLLVYGDQYADDYFRTLNVILVPCNYVGSLGNH